VGEYCIFGLYLGIGTIPGGSTLGLSIPYLCRCKHEFRVFVTTMSEFVSMTFMQSHITWNWLQKQPPQSKLELSALLMSTKVIVHGLPRKEIDPATLWVTNNDYNHDNCIQPFVYQKLSYIGHPDARKCTILHI